MGYTTDFSGRFKLNKPLDAELLTFLQKFNRSRRMKLRVGPEFGVEGEFYVQHADDAYAGQIEHNDPRVIDYNTPPKTQPGLWCQWEPSEDGQYIQWDGGEKFYCYIEWIQYLITNFLAPKGYTLTGDVDWQGEESGDFGTIRIVENVISISEGRRNQGPFRRL